MCAAARRPAARARCSAAAGTPPPPPPPPPAAAAFPVTDVLFVSSVWPEPSASAAGVRTADLIDCFRGRGARVSYASAAAPNAAAAALAAAGVAAHEVQPNREARFLEVLADALGPPSAQGPGPTISAVVFDRHFCEAMFSFRVRAQHPGALRILDMQDVHFLRAGRRALAAAGASAAEVLACRPGADSAEALREIAAIHRSDLTLVCSPVELELLASHYGVPRAKLALAPFFFARSPHAPGGGGPPAPGFAGRRDVMMIGNWLHPPNADSARWAAEQVWPLLRRRLLADGGAGSGSAPPPELHIYGAYEPASAAAALHRPDRGVRLLGHAPTLDVMLRHRLLLAPLRFGAGLKGKVADAWRHGLPVVTTPVGAEGMHDAASAGGAAAWGGRCGGGTAEELAADAAALYADADGWAAAQAAGFRLVAALYDRDARLGDVAAAVAAAAAGLEQRRRADFFGAALWAQTARSTEYFSRWVELKEAAREREREAAAREA